MHLPIVERWPLNKAEYKVRIHVAMENFVIKGLVILVVAVKLSSKDLTLVKYL